MRFARAVLCVVLPTIALVAPVLAQENAREEAARRSAALESLPKDAAKRLFGLVTEPAPGNAHVVGSYGKGCFTGGVQMPVYGETWQVMRTSRNRNWGHPVLVAFLERLAKKAAANTTWPGILIGDMAQPRGGPMLTGHASHQLGIEVDVWLKRMPDRHYTADEREEVSSTNLVRPDGLDIDPNVYTPQHLALLKTAAREPGVDRIFVNAAIKKALCRDATGDRGWLAKIRPWYGHNYHFHIRLGCPKGESACVNKIPPPSGEGCGELAYWFTDAVLHPKRQKPGPPMSIDAMPAACQALVKK